LIKDFVMLRHEASSSPCKAALYVEEDPSLSLRMTSKKAFVMLRHEASSSPCKAALYVEEDPSLSLRMTNFIY